MKSIVWPWNKIEQRLITYLNDLAHAIQSVKDEIQRLRYDEKREDHFVVVLLIAKDEKGVLTSTGKSLRVRGKETVRLQPYINLTDIRVLVFCDLEKVRVWCIRRGVEVVNCSFGTTPIGEFESLQVGVNIEVDLEGF